MTDRKFAPHMQQPAARIAGFPGSLEEPYRAVQAQGAAAPETMRGILRVQRFLSQRLVFLSAVALLLGGLFGLALIWTFSFWMH